MPQIRTVPIPHGGGDGELIRRALAREEAAVRAIMAANNKTELEAAWSLTKGKKKLLAPLG